MPPTNPPTPVRVVCTCTSFGCGKQTFANEQGDDQPGRKVSTTTRTRHMNRDRTQNAAVSILASTSQMTALESEPDQTDVAQQDSSDTEVREVPENSERVSGARNMDPVDDTLDFSQKTLFMLACTLAVWLHLKCGLSREATNQVLKVLGLLVGLAVNVANTVIQTQIPDYITGPIHLPPIPYDVRTAMNTLSLKPKIIRSICCPKCYTKYSLSSLPKICSRRETYRSRICNETLWVTRSTRAGPRHVPRCLYSTQDFESWLEFFLSRPGIEDLIDESYAHCVSPGVMHSIWDSPAWHSLGSFTTTPGNLTFSYYIDWFNPLSNKIAGKSMSCGAIMLFCLNLPYELQHLVENTFFAGLTPLPKEPTVTTITALADPIVERLQAMYNGKIIRTHRHPNGVMKRAAVLPFIANLLAIRKALGFAGHRSHNFCSFCDLQLSEIDCLDPKMWNLRIGANVRMAAEEWLHANTKVQRKKIFDKFGVRWSSMHQLHYHDQVQHTMLGMMHNWIEGILQHHMRVNWGVGIVFVKSGDVEDTGKVTTTTTTTPTGNNIDFDIDMLDDELAELEAESQGHSDTPSHGKRLHSESSVHFSDDDDDNNDSIYDGEFQPDFESESDDDLDIEEDKVAKQAVCIFGPEAMSKIRDCIAEAHVPTWIAHPPRNLGEKSHGKLKADQWLTLFTIFLPMILPEIWLSSRQTCDSALLDNFHDLIKCTNIVCSYSASNPSADDYLDHYIKYRQSSKNLFPIVSSKPNHHYAMHNAELMKFWGPLPMLSEFPYEQHNGALQKIKTNWHTWEMDFTMLHQICRRGRLSGFIQKYIDTDSAFGAALKILFLGSATTSNNESRQNSKGQKLSPQLYDLILAHINALWPNTPFRHYKDLPHPLDARVLPPVAISIQYIIHKGRQYSTFSAHPGGSSISFHCTDGTVDMGFITTMWTQVLLGVLCLFIIVAPHTAVVNSPYVSLPGLMGTLIYSQPNETQKRPHVLIEQRQIQSQVAYYNRPPGTFGIKSGVRVLVDSLHHNR